MSGMDEYYTILGVTKNAKADEIKVAFFTLLSKYRDLTDQESEKNVKAIVDAYEHLQKCEVVLRPDNTLDMTYSKNGTIEQYNAAGTVVIELFDNKGNSKQFDDQGNPTKIRMKDGSAFDYYPNSDKILKHRDKYGNETFYRPDKKVNMYFDAKKKIQYIYKEDGKTLKTAINNKGDIAHYWPDGKHVFSIKSNKGTAFFAKDGKTKTSEIDTAGNETVYRTDKNNKIIVALKKFADGSIVEYDESGKKPKVIIDIYGRTVEHLSDGSTEYRRRDGSLMRKDDDKGNINIYEADGITLFYSRSNTGLETYYQDDGIHPLYTKDRQGNETSYYEYSDKKRWSKDKYGNEKYYQEDGEKLIRQIFTKGKIREIYYQDDGETPLYKIDENNNLTLYFENTRTRMMTMDSEQNKIFYRTNGKDVLSSEDASGNTVHYARGDKKKLYEEDTEGNKIFYRADGVTKWYTADKNGNKRYLKDDGVTPDYDVIDGKKIPYKAETPSRPMRLARRSRLAMKRLFQTVRG